MRWEVRMIHEDGPADYRNACIYDVDTGERILRCAGGLPEDQAQHVVDEHNKCLMAPTGLMKAAPLPEPTKDDPFMECYECGTKNLRSHLTKSLGQRYRCGPCQAKCDAINAVPKPGRKRIRIKRR